MLPGQYVFECFIIIYGLYVCVFGECLIMQHGGIRLKMQEQFD